MGYSKTIGLAVLCLVASAVLGKAPVVCALDQATLTEWKERFRNPPEACWPQTYWCWPGNAVTKDEISWELAQMHQHNIGGVLLNSAMAPVYEKGNIPYLSTDYLAMVRHTAKTAARLNMKLNINLGEHWVFGGYWVPPRDRSQSLVPTAIDVRGPRLFAEALPMFQKAADHRAEINATAIPDEEKLVAVVAGQIHIEQGDVAPRIDAATLVELTSRVEDHRLTWQVPPGNWRVMAFWLKYTGQGSASAQWPRPHWCIDHFSKEAVTR